MISLGGLVNQKAFGKFEMGRVISDPFATAFIKEGEDGTDYEVSMAEKQLDDIIKSATELKAKMGDNEFNVAAWIQDHISKSQNYINQANYGFDKNESVNEQSPCWKGYEQIGMKDKNGKQVPNCVPKNESVLDEARSVKVVQTELLKTLDAIQKELAAFKAKKGTPDAQKHVDNLKKLNSIKTKLENELDSSVSSLYKDAELKIEN